MTARRSRFTSNSSGRRSMTALRTIVAVPKPSTNASRKPTVAMSAMPMVAPMHEPCTARSIAIEQKCEQRTAQNRDGK